MAVGVPVELTSCMSAPAASTPPLAVAGADPVRDPSATMTSPGTEPVTLPESHEMSPPRSAQMPLRSSASAITVMVPLSPAPPSSTTSAQ